jgi:hypothetical protein
VVDRSVGAGPINLVVDQLPHWDIASIEFRIDTIKAGEHALSLHDAQRYDSSLHIPKEVDHARFRANLVACRDHLIIIAPAESLSFLLEEKPAGSAMPRFENALRARFIDAIGLLQNGRLKNGVQLIKGLGRGLTPQGDDFIAGVLFALHLRGSAFGESIRQEIADMHAAAQSNNPFSQAMLDCAAQGRAFERLNELIGSLFGADNGLIEARARELMGIGATSGADIAAGLLFGLMGYF